MKRIRKVAGKAAAARAQRELKALAAARQELLARWQFLLMDKTLSRETLMALRKARNALQDHLQPADLTGALRDKLGIPVRKSGSGKAWDHLDEVDSALGSTRRLHTRLKRDLHRVHAGSAEFKQLSREMEAINETLARVKSFLEIR